MMNDTVHRCWWLLCLGVFTEFSVGQQYMVQEVHTHTGFDQSLDCLSPQTYYAQLIDLCLQVWADFEWCNQHAIAGEGQHNCVLVQLGRFVVINYFLAQCIDKSPMSQRDIEYVTYLLKQIHNQMLLLKVDDNCKQLIDAQIKQTTLSLTNSYERVTTP